MLFRSVALTFTLMLLPLVRVARLHTSRPLCTLHTSFTVTNFHLSRSSISQHVHRSSLPSPPHTVILHRVVHIKCSFRRHFGFSGAFPAYKHDVKHSESIRRAFLPLHNPLVGALGCHITATTSLYNAHELKYDLSSPCQWEFL